MSYNGTYVVRVQPGESVGDTYGFAGAKKGRYARASVFRAKGEDRYEKVREFDLLNPVAPIDFVVSNAGEVVTLDNWHNMGMGKVLVIYAPDGSVRTSYALSDIYSRTEVGRFEASVSSIWWRCNYPPFLGRGATKFEVMDKIGNTLEVSLGSGTIEKKPGASC